MTRGRGRGVDGGGVVGMGVGGRGQHGIQAAKLSKQSVCTTEHGAGFHRVTPILVEKVANMAPSLLQTCSQDD